MSGLTDFLERNKDNRGLMARLRQGLREAQQDRAWPVLSRFCDVSAQGRGGQDEHVYQVTRTVAGLFALHPLSGGGNMGELCRRLCGDDETKALRSWWSSENGEKHDGPMGRHLLHVLAADRSEICARVVRLVQYAKARTEPVNYERLEQDLLSWPKARGVWAQWFWGASPTDGQQNTEDLSAEIPDEEEESA